MRDAAGVAAHRVAERGRDGELGARAHRDPLVGVEAGERAARADVDEARAAREAGPAERLAPFALTGSGIARQGNPVVGGGEVTSGTMSPSLGHAIGMAYLPADKAQPGTEIEIDVRGKVRTAEVREKPLYSKET